MRNQVNMRIGLKQNAIKLDNQIKMEKKIKRNGECYELTVTGVLHLILLIIAIFYTLDLNLQNRAAFMEITLGQFRSEPLAQHAPVQQLQVATRPDPCQIPPEYRDR